MASFEWWRRCDEHEDDKATSHAAVRQQHETMPSGSWSLTSSPRA